jgi:hypothetical protein
MDDDKLLNRTLWLSFCFFYQLHIPDQLPLCHSLQRPVILIIIFRTYAQHPAHGALRADGAIENRQYNSHIEPRTSNILRLTNSRINKR